MITLFFSIYQFFKTRKILFFVSTIIVFFLLGYWASRIKFEEDVSKLIPSNKDSQQINTVLQNMNFSDKIIINVSSEKPENLTELQNYANEFSKYLVKDSAYIKKIQSRFEDDQMAELLGFVSSNLPLYLDENDYKKIDSLLQLVSIDQKVREAYHSIVSPSGMVTTQMVRADPFGFSFLALNKFKRLQSGDQFKLQDGYLVHQNGNNLFVFISPKAKANETSENAILMEAIDKSIDSLNLKYKNSQISAECFGATPVSVANAKQIKSDIILTLSISLVLLFTLFIYFYRKFYIPLIIIIPAIFGSLLGIVVLYLLKGTISAISIGIGSVLLGLTLDYSLHILSHYRSTGDIKKLFQSTTKPLIVCAVFTAADFLCLLFLHSDVLKDLGIFAAVSVLGAVFFALIFVPQVYKPKPAQTRQNTFIDKLSRYDFSKNKWLLGISILLIIISLFTYKNVGFENDLNKLNFMPEDLETAENNLDELNNYSSKSIYLAAYGNNYEEASRANSKLFETLKKLESEKEILTFNSISSIALSKQVQIEKIKTWNEFWTIEKKESLKNQLLQEGKKYGFKENTFQPFFSVLDETYSIRNLNEDPLLKNLFLDEFVSSEKGLTTITSIIKTDNPDTEKLIKKLSYADENILVVDRKHLQETFLSNLEADFNKLFFISSIVIFLILLLFFRSLELTLITNIPIFVGWLATLGMMGVFGLNFNAFNIIITTLIFGLGVDYSIFITRGLIEKYTYGTDEMAAFRSGILMSALATILCFGVLVFAKHPAIYSISWIPIIGLCVVVLMSFTIQPWLFNFLIQNPQDKGNTPRTLFNLILTTGTFGYFFVGGFILNILAQVFFPLLPFGKKKKFKIFHKTVHTYFKTLMYGTPFVKINVIEKKNLNFEKPRIIIANHTSQLDTPTLGMIHPKSIFMVNNRVLNSRFFGKSIQMAGFYSVSGGYEENLDDLREKIRQGYSLIIFPEGTRSRTSAVQRFHKGAFYLAHELNLEILPVLVRGNADLLPKNDNVLKTGKLTLQYLPLIKPDDEQFGKTYSERTKKINVYFREKFIELKRNDEDENYFIKKLKFNYIYKPRYIQKEFNSDFELNKKTYNKLLDLISPKAKILHLGSGYGVLDFLLAYDSPSRSILAWDADVEKLKIAQNTFSVNRFPVKFIENLPQDLSTFDIIILQDSEKLKQFEILVNLENWTQVFRENGITVFKNAGRV